MSIIIFTDGSSRGNPGPGGWACVIKHNIEITELGGGEKHTTNNRMELMAVIQGLKYVKEKMAEIHSGTGGNVDSAYSESEITVCTDSTYIVKGISMWIHGWKRNGWKTKAKGEVLNKDLWVMLSEISDALLEDSVKVNWKIVPGHAGIVGNERCDVIATSFADGNEVSLYKGPFSGYDLQDMCKVMI